jgi:dihydroorotate dehydrogenase
MFDYYRFLRPLLFTLPPEAAHSLVISTLKRGWIPVYQPLHDSRLGMQCLGLGFDSPIGLSAGFDKNADVFSACFRHGFGFAEIGTVTPKAQKGNPKPRIFRLKRDEAIINRLGFNNRGAEHALRNIFAQESERLGIVGVNIGKNKDTAQALDDYLPLIDFAYELADYITVNISSPNTQGLRDLQSEETFKSFIQAIMQERNSIAAYKGFRRPILVKIAPDMEENALYSLLDTMMDYHVDGVIISNTTIARPPSLQSSHRSEAGGLSGRPLQNASLTMLRRAYQHTEGAIPLIGVGGIMSGADAVQRIRAGASLLQLYTALIYRGFGLITEIKRALLSEVEKLGVVSVQELVGVDASR